MTRAGALLCAILATVVVSSACGEPPTESASSPDAGMSLPGDFGGSGPGTLVAATTMPTLDRRLEAVTSVAAKVTYTSTSGVTNELTEVTGTVFAPRGAPPEGGWPIIAYGHPTTGVRADCAPSSSPTLLNLSATILGLVNSGYVVAMSDYQGLGNDRTYHPYLDATTEGYNLVDSVRAARKLVADTSDRWASFGVSQGGQGAWAANELSADYGAGLTLVGSVSVSAPLDITGFADAAAGGTLTKDQQPAYSAVLEALKNEYPDINLDDYRRGIVQSSWDELLQCDYAKADERAQLVDQITPDDLRPSSVEATDALRGRLAEASLPRRPLTTPALVIYGGQDALIPPSWTDAALQRACELGDVIRIDLQPDKGHSDVDIGPVIGWLGDRFRGEPAPNSCPSFITPPPPAPEEEPAAEEPEVTVEEGG
ncbi:MULTISPECIES: lipase family protein [unclassified Mycobacterium]|uniref:lipase family protein n=1 Tax=unclassified Mycobacterium TaxID=2642494 RepID=UPI0029C80F6F|nr:MULTISPECIES: lipase family protein [unclassified Mycobacterium]